MVQRALPGTGVLADDVDRADFHSALTEAVKPGDVELHAYGLWLEEARLLVTPRKAGALSAMMQSVGRRYVRRFNLRHHATGTPWAGRFRSTVVEVPSHFVDSLRFVEFQSPSDDAAAASGAPQSSAAHHLGRESSSLTQHAAFWRLGNTPFEREAAYRRHLDAPMPADRWAAVRQAAWKGWPLGGPAFLDGLREAVNRRLQPLGRGRPPANGLTPKIKMPRGGHL